MKTFAKPSIGVLAMIAAAGALPVPSSFADAASDPHANHHHHMMKESMRSMADYTIPQVPLIREDGKRILLQDELNDGRAVVMNFIFTTCTAICPVTSQTFSLLQGKLGNARDRVHMVSISIDPEHDTPDVLKKYARKWGAGDEWQFYTGTVEASIAAQQAFGVYRGDKMNHVPVTLLRTAPGKPWVRIDGFATADELLGELGNMLAVK